MKEENSYNHVLKYTGLLGGVQVFYVLMSVVRNKFTALFIGTEGMGWADLYTRAIELMGGMTSFGIAFSAVRRLSVLSGQERPALASRYVCLVRTWILIAALSGLFVTLLCAPFISRLTTGDYAHTLHFALLSPAVMLATLLSGELAVLKGMRHLSRMAAVSVLAALATVLVTVPLYALLGLQGIIPVLLSTSLVVFLLNFRASTRLYPYRVRLRPWRFVRQGTHLLRIGSAYVAACVAGYGAEMLIRAFLMRTEGGPAQAGLYAVGLTLTVSYARLVFVAMDADYFPRVSALMDNPPQLSLAVNRQTDVLVQLMTPFLLLFIPCLPLVVRMLYTTDFLAAIPMVLCALPYMYFKAVYVSLSYLPLAAGDSRVYLLMELVYDFIFALAVIAGYRMGGLVGAGLGLSLANLADLVLLSAFYPRRYGVRLDPAVLRRCLCQFVLLVAGLACARLSLPWMRLGGGVCCLSLSVVLSLRMLGRETLVADKLKGLFLKIKKKR